MTARAEVRRAGRLFLAHEADEGLEHLIRQSDELARAGRRIDRPAEALLESRFSRLLRQDPQTLRTFAALEPAEKRLVVELGETAQRLARRYPAEAETMVRRLGPEGLTAVRVFGDDVAEVLVKEGPESLGVLRKAGRGGWSFFTKYVLPHKKKLAAAGVLAAFLADPEKFVDYAGQATEYAVREFGKAGIQLASAVGGGAVRGIEDTIGQALSSYGLNLPILRYLGMGLAGLAVIGSFLIDRRAAGPVDVSAGRVGFPADRVCVPAHHGGGVLSWNHLDREDWCRSESASCRSYNEGLRRTGTPT